MLQINNLTYGYRAKQNVFENFSLQYSEPGVYGLLGKNGTGKSTLLYLIMGLLRPHYGTVTFDGLDTTLRQPETLSEMFIVPEEYDMPSITLPQYVKAIKPFYPKFSLEMLTELLEVFGMTHTNGAQLDADNIPTIDLKALSMGQKKKIYLCIALAARTKILLMDEPTNGLDIPSKSQFRKVVAKGMREDQIIIISTHQVRDVEQLLDHVTIVDQNAVLANQAIDMEKPLDLEEMFIKTLEQQTQI